MILIYLSTFGLGVKCGFAFADVTELSRENRCPNLDSEVFVEAIDENNPIFSELSDVPRHGIF